MKRNNSEAGENPFAHSRPDKSGLRGEFFLRKNSKPLKDYPLSQRSIIVTVFGG